jgi:hypothetical protein
VPIFKGFASPKKNFKKFQKNSWQALAYMILLYLFLKNKNKNK